MHSLYPVFGVRLSESCPDRYSRGYASPDGNLHSAILVFQLHPAALRSLSLFDATLFLRLLVLALVRPSADTASGGERG